MIQQIKAINVETASDGEKLITLARSYLVRFLAPHTAISMIAVNTINDFGWLCEELLACTVRF